MIAKTLNVQVGTAHCHFRYSGEANVIKPTMDDGVYICNLQRGRWCIAYTPPAVIPSEVEKDSKLIIPLIDTLLRIIPPIDYPEGFVDIQLTDLFVEQTR